MKKEHCLFIGAGILILGSAYYYHAKRKGVSVTNVGAMTGHFKGYTKMMKLPPEYYNSTSIEGGSFNTEDYNSEKTYITPWTLGSNGGNAELINAGWTSFPDTYSAKVSNAWLQQEAQGAHL